MAETGTVEAPETAPAATTTAAPEAIDWSTQIPADYAKDAAWKPLAGKPLGDVLKGYAEAQRLVGSSIRLPGKDAKPEDLAKWKSEQLPKLQAAGLVQVAPESPEKYTVTRPETAADLGWDEQAEQGFLAVAHKAGLTQAQVDAIVGWYGNDFGTSLTKSVQTEIAEGTAALEQEWGGDFTPFLGRAERFVNDHFSEASRDLMRTSGIGRNPEFIKDVLGLANRLVEHGLMSGTAAGEISADDLATKTTAIRTEMTKVNAGSTRYAELKTQLENLYKQATGLRTR